MTFWKNKQKLKLLSIMLSHRQVLALEQSSSNYGMKYSLVLMLYLKQLLNFHFFAAEHKLK